MKVLIYCLVCLWCLQGCKLFENQHGVGAVVNSVDDGVEEGVKERKKQPLHGICFVQSDDKKVTKKYHCDFNAWMNFWLKHNSLSWLERREMIEKLGDSPDDLLKKVLLSQRRGTPYQNRLRAQGWLDQLETMLTNDTNEWLDIIVHQPSQQLLEFESALTILTRINTNHAKEIEAQQDTIKEQRQQIEQLLKIEASMMEKREGIKQ